MNAPKNRIVGCIASLIFLPLMACDGNSGGGPMAGPSSAPAAWAAGVYAPSETYANLCEAPREGVNPATGLLFPDKSGTLMHEKMWLRSLVNELYLWQDEVADVDPAALTLEQYFHALTVPQDRFSFFQNSERAHAGNQGIAVDYGIQWDFSETEPGNFVVRVGDVAAASPLYGVVQRGDTLEEVDGIALGPISHAEHGLIIQALYPGEPDEVHAIKLRKLESDELLELTLMADETTYATVPRFSAVPSGSGQVGYLQFNQHLDKSEAELITAVDSMAKEGITDLVLDLRYNGGGYIDIASQLAYMVAGPGHTSGEIFYQAVFNDRLGGLNPYTQQPPEPFPFHQMTLFAEGDPAPLPTLNLDRVFVLTTGGTCSASEAVINGLKGVGVEVLQFGLPTCGKPYGGVQEDNCGKAYNFVLFKGANGQGYGDFTEGFIPSGSAEQLADNILPGCQISDDLNHQLGDPAEAMLAAALYFREHGTCPPVMVQALQARGQGLQVELPRPPVHGRSLLRH